MEIKGRELEGIVNDLSQITNVPVHQFSSVQFKLAYRLKKITDKLQSAFKELDKKRVILVKKYGIEDKVKKSVTVPEDKLGEFQKEWDLILDSMIAIDIEPIPMELLSAAGIRINLIELAAIEKFIDKPKE